MMKKFATTPADNCLYSRRGCCSSNKSLERIHTFEIPPSNLIEEHIESFKDVTSIRSYELSDGTWKADYDSTAERTRAAMDAQRLAMQAEADE